MAAPYGTFNQTLNDLDFFVRSFIHSFSLSLEHHFFHRFFYTNLPFASPALSHLCLLFHHPLYFLFPHFLFPPTFAQSCSHLYHHRSRQSHCNPGLVLILILGVEILYVFRQKKTEKNCNFNLIVPVKLEVSIPGGCLPLRGRFLS